MKTEINAVVIEEMGRRRHGARRWRAQSPERQAEWRAALVQTYTEVKQAEAVVERRRLQEAR